MAAMRRKAPLDPRTATQFMQCMEVWGGNQVVDSGVVMAGLDAWVYCKPYGQAAGGGDVYYVSSCATGRITRLLVADVTGHGAAVCDTAGQLRTLMRQYVNYLDQTRFVQSMNAQFAALSRNGCFATAVVTTFFAPTNQLTLCNAGHPPPLLYRAATRRWDFLSPPASAPPPARRRRRTTPAAPPAAGAEGLRNIPLGILDLADYAQFDVRLRVGDLVLCYTDSLPEARDERGEMLGQAGLLETVRSLGPPDSATLVPKLLAHIAARAEGNLAADDVTVLLFRPNGLTPRLRLRERVRGPVRVLRGVLSALRAGGGPLPLPDFSLANLGGALFHPLNHYWTGRRRRRGGREKNKAG